MLGDAALRNLKVEVNGETASRCFDDCVFRIVSKLNYRAKTDVHRVLKASQFSDDPEAAAAALGLDEARRRADVEAAQNEDALRVLRAEGSGIPLLYGDVIQLEHRKSKLFLASHKTPALMNTSTRKVTLKAGSAAAHLRVLPRFKARSIGSPVYASDQIILESLKFAGMYIGATGRPENQYPFAKPQPALCMRLPLNITDRPMFEVNGSTEVRSFEVHVYAKIQETDRESLLTGLHAFRLFHPELNG